MRLPAIIRLQDFLTRIQLRAGFKAVKKIDRAPGIVRNAVIIMAKNIESSTYRAFVLWSLLSSRNKISDLVNDNTQ
jgi:hypothetical protein